MFSRDQLTIVTSDGIVADDIVATARIHDPTVTRDNRASRRRSLRATVRDNRSGRRCLLSLVLVVLVFVARLGLWFGLGFAGRSTRTNVRKRTLVTTSATRLFPEEATRWVVFERARVAGLALTFEMQSTHTL